MAERGVERAVGGLHRRHEDQHLAARGRDELVKQCQRLDVLFDVLEDVDAHDGVEALTHQVGVVALLEVGDMQRDLRLAVERGARARDAIQVGLDADQPLGELGELEAGGADAAADLEDVRADVRAEQLEDVRLVARRLAHRFEVVGGVLLLRLGEPVVDVHV